MSLPGIKEAQLKGRKRKRPPGILSKLNIVKTTPNFACSFVYVCLTLPGISFAVVWSLSP